MTARKRKRPIAPGQVWWCDGAALGFEAHFKTRPVLVVAATGEGGDSWLAMPLSSRRRYQEPAVTHGGKISYMTGRRAIVAASALLSYSGDWEGFADWREGAARPVPFSLWDWLRRLFRR